MDLQLKDKVVIVTGGASGIGAAIVSGAAREGAVAVIVDKSAQAAHEVECAVRKDGGQAHAIIADLMAAGIAGGRSKRRSKGVAGSTSL